MARTFDEYPKMRRSTEPLLNRFGYGFTLMETMVIVSIISVLSALAFSITVKEIWSAEARGAAQEISSWMEAVRRNATRGANCNVSISASSSATSSTTIATASVGSSGSVSLADQCLTSNPLKLGSSINSSSTFQIQVSPTSSFTFTSRGTMYNTSTSNGDFTSDLQISVNTVSGGSARAPMYCVRVRPPLGEIDVIYNLNATSGRCA